jgi:hypothetical protein
VFFLLDEFEFSEFYEDFGFTFFDCVALNAHALNLVVRILCDVD